MKNIWSFLSFVVLLLILLVDLSSKFSKAETAPTSAETAPTSKVVNAQEINLVDKDGRKCASFFINETGEASIELGPTKEKGLTTSVVTPNGIDIYKSDGDGHGVNEVHLGAESGVMYDQKRRVLWSIP